jgi:DNA-binding NarL/FixJ family response regulator
MRLDDLDEVEVIGEAGTVPDAVQLAVEHSPDVALLSDTGHGMDLEEAIETLKRHCDSVRVIVLVPYEDDAAKVLSAGASAHLLKESGVATLGAVIRKVVRD